MRYVTRDADNQKMNSAALLEYNKSRQICLKRWSEYLHKSSKEFVQYESIMINSSREKIWDVITNWSLLRKLSPCIADEIEFDGDQNVLGNKIKLIYNVGRNYVSIFEVVRVNNGTGREDWEYFMALHDSSPKIPYQEFRFAIIWLSPEICFLSFKHVYKERLNINMLNVISAEKKMILKDIKAI